MSVCAADALTVDNFFQRNGNQVLEQVKQVRDRRGRMISRQITQIDSPNRTNGHDDTLSLQGHTHQLSPERALVVALGQLAQPHREQHEQPDKQFSRQEFDFLWRLFGRERQ